MAGSTPNLPFVPNVPSGSEAMSDEGFPVVQSIVDSPPEFWPSAALRRLMFWGALAAVVGGGLSLGSLASQDDSVRLFLDLVGIAPLLVLLGAYLRLAKELPSLTLRRTSIGLFGILLLFSFVGLADTEQGGEEWVAWVVLIAMTLLTIVVIGIVIKRPSWATITTAESTSSGEKKAGWGGLGFVLLAKFFLLKKLARLFGGFELEFFGPVVLFIMGMLAISFLFAGGIVKLRLTRRLGVTAGVLGFIEIVVPVVVAILCGVFFYSLYQVVERVGEDQQAMDAAMDQLAQAWRPRAVTGGILMQSAWSLATLVFFWTVRGNADPDEVLASEG
jgi:hypothetical protein